jgi:hypothetical protein
MTQRQIGRVTFLQRRFIREHGGLSKLHLEELAPPRPNYQPPRVHVFMAKYHPLLGPTFESYLIGGMGKVHLQPRN